MLRACALLNTNPAMQNLKFHPKRPLKPPERAPRRTAEPKRAHDSNQRRNSLEIGRAAAAAAAEKRGRTQATHAHAVGEAPSEEEGRTDGVRE